QFGPETTTPGVSGATSVAVADFNADGHPDLAVTGWDGVSVLLNDGTGTFGFPTAYAAGGINNWVSVGDFNLDGKADLAVGYSNGDGHPDLVATSFIPPGGGGSAVLVWLNDGSGGFPAFTRYLTDGFGSNPIGSAAADLDQDGILDVVAANDFSDTLSLFT